MRVILYTATKCPKCPAFRRLLREAAGELGLREGIDFVEKLIDGGRVAPGSKVELDGEELHIVNSPADIKETPAAVGGRDFTIEALRYQIASTPSLVVDGELAFVGEVPSKEELLEKLK
jgi:hypothetical protein